MELPPMTQVAHHPILQDVSDILANRTNNDQSLYFRVMTAYVLSKVPSAMRANIALIDGGVIPVNAYAICLGPSGMGKTKSMNLLEDKVIGRFFDAFTHHLFPLLTEERIALLASERAYRAGTDPAEEEKKLRKDFESTGETLFNFDSATTAAMKQMRDKLLISGAGSMNLEIDEIGSNIQNATEILNAYLELYDVGKIKPKLVKNTQENVRIKHINGRTPANMLLFGTPSKLLNGSRVEEDFISLLETGMGRRSLFGYAPKHVKRKSNTAEQLLNEMSSDVTNQFLSELNAYLGELACKTYFERTITLDKHNPATLIWLQYKLDCEARADALFDHEEVLKIEISHRYFKALKLAGVYAFIDKESHISQENMLAAIKLVEESGEALEKILSRERAYVKLARYIAQAGRDLTSVDFNEDLPFYKGSKAVRDEMLQLAIAWGYTNNIIIKRRFSESIEFFRGESLSVTDHSALKIAHSPHLADGFEATEIGFDELHELTQMAGHGYTNHFLKDGIRREDHVIPGFNLLVLDVENSVSIDTAMTLLKDYKYHIHTTKRHTDEHHRYRILMPLSHELKLSQREYKAFMQNIYAWLPFDVDTATSDRVRKWATCEGQYWENDGLPIDALDFIPATSKAEKKAKQIQDLRSLSSIERWFVLNTYSGNRNNQYLRYAMMLVDGGEHDLADIQQALFDLNDKVSDPLPEIEIQSTILTSVSRALSHRA